MKLNPNKTFERHIVVGIALLWLLGGLKSVVLASLDVDGERIPKKGGGYRRSSNKKKAARGLPMWSPTIVLPSLEPG